MLSGGNTAMRIKVKCIGKKRNSKGAIEVYQMIDENGVRFQTTGKQIKEEMRAGRLRTAS